MIEIVYVLLALNVVQLIFWSFQVQKLVDKLMAKNLTEYRTSKTKVQDLKPKIEDQEEVKLGDFRI